MSGPKRFNNRVGGKDMFQMMLVISALLCSLVAGFLFAYAIVVMPGLEKLDDAAFIRAFQVTDRVIQDNQPVFLVVWLGSAVAVIISWILSFGAFNGLDFFLMTIAFLTYLLGVQVMTVVIHLPLNNRLQQLDVADADQGQLKAARTNFEAQWNKSNRRRTAMACAVALVLIYMVLRAG
ncbi:MAG: anthrone oxygenase family protein [Pseudomonadota bacterium]